MSNETSEERWPLRLAWSTDGPNRYGMHDGVIYATCYRSADLASVTHSWIGDPDLPARRDCRQAAHDAEAAALVGAQARLAEAHNVVRALLGSL